MSNIQSFDSFNEEKNWIKDAIKKPGALRKSLHKKKGEKISKSEINSELSKLKSKDRDPEKPGTQLGKRDAKKFKRLNLAKTFKSMHEAFTDSATEDIDNYSLFDDLQEIKELADKLIELESDMDDSLISEYSNIVGPMKDKLFSLYETITEGGEGEQEDYEDDGLDSKYPEDIENLDLIEDEDNEETEQFPQDGNISSFGNFNK